MYTSGKEGEMMSRILRFFAAILAFFIFSPSDAQIAPYAPLDKDDLQISFTVISDGHLESNNAERHNNYGEGFLDMARAEVPSRALVMVGDNTMNGQLFEQGMLYGLLRKYNTIENVLMAAGNHDICGSDYNMADYDRLKKRFIRYNNAFLDHQIDELYHYAVIDGYYFVVLGSDKDAGVEQYISPEQFSWLDGVLKEASASGKPVFLFNHWPLNDVFPEVWTEGHVGAQSDELKAALQKYGSRIFYFSGHLHMGVFEGDGGYKEEGLITYINVPSFGSENTNGDADAQETGLGLQVEVYENELVVRVRNFVQHEWTDYEYRFAL